jgi:acetaldehyde dehydrogenase/alcohol dehydrogenase
VGTVKKVIEGQEQNVEMMMNDLVEKANVAKKQFMELDQKTVDEIVKQMALAGIDKHMPLAKLAVEETKRGVYEDKIIKNMFATEYIYNSIKNDKTVGVVETNDEEAYQVVAEPIGVIAGVTPVTNPTSTTMFKAIIAMKTRNPIIFSFHPSAQKSSSEAAKVVRDAAIKAGAPKNCIQWIEKPSIEASNALMKHDGIALILATGGPGMVKAAYSSGKPALGVGSGNVPCYIHESADLHQAVTDLILSKTFDNGMICASEQAVIIDQSIYTEATKLMKYHSCYFLSKAEIKKVEAIAIDQKRQSMAPQVVGQSAHDIAKMAGVDVPEDTKILIAELDGVGSEYPLSREKLSPILACYKVKNSKEGIKRAVEMTEFGGLGHSAVIHANDDEVIENFSINLRTGRLLVNAPSTHGAIGDLYNANIPSLTLGCGSMGNNSTTDNVSAINLINFKRVAKRRVNMQWFKVPEKIYHEFGSVQYLAKMPNVERVIIVTDRVMQNLGYVDKLIYHLNKRMNHVAIEIFSDVEPDPSVETVLDGAEMMKRFKPDTIISLGGGSAMDAAKGMWLFYEYPDVDFNSLRLKFLDIRKRAFKFPKLGRKAKMVAIPTTSGTGSEVTAFTVITDKKNNVKYPLADYELTPDVAILDPDFVMSVPKSVTADTGLDVLTHAIEAYVSVMATDFTDALAIKAAQLIFDYLPRAYKNGDDREAREKVHNASCMAGMAFTNAFLGVNHSMAHKLGGEFHIAHGRANAILLPHIIRYNAKKPTKFASFPKYKEFVADEKYAEIAKALGLKFKTTSEGVEALASAIENMMKELNVPFSLEEMGVDKKEYMERVDYLADRAFEDQCTPANPKLPLVSELTDLYKAVYPKRSVQ